MDEANVHMDATYMHSHACATLSAVHLARQTRQGCSPTTHSISHRPGSLSHAHWGRPRPLTAVPCTFWPFTRRFVASRTNDERRPIARIAASAGWLSWCPKARRADCRTLLLDQLPSATARGFGSGMWRRFLSLASRAERHPFVFRLLRPPVSARPPPTGPSRNVLRPPPNDDKR